MKAYYNDNDRHIVAWLKELIKAGMITDGDVDDRSIKDVKGTDLKGYSRCHFFAGIGGWDTALQLAGWPSDRYVWTGSCPCQPLSGAGQRKGEKDERHLWPDFYRLISECRPSTVFGEQVASRDGREWFAGVRADLEALDYAVGGSDLCAAGEFAPHIRQRLYWVADTGHNERLGWDAVRCADGQPTGTESEGQGSCKRGENCAGVGSRVRASDDSPGSGQDSRVADSERGRCEQRDEEKRPGSIPHQDFSTGRMGNTERGGLSGEYGRRSGQEPKDGCQGSGVGNSLNDGCPDGCEETRGTLGQGEQGRVFQSKGTGSGLGDTDSAGLGELRGSQPVQQEQRPVECAGGQSYWSNSIYIPCGDGKKRRIEPGISPLVDGLPGRVGLLRGYGNAIVPQVAARFIRVFQEVRQGRDCD